MPETGIISSIDNGPKIKKFSFLGSKIIRPVDSESKTRENRFFASGMNKTIILDGPITINFEIVLYRYGNKYENKSHIYFRIEEGKIIRTREDSLAFEYHFKLGPDKEDIILLQSIVSSLFGNHLSKDIKGIISNLI